MNYYLEGSKKYATFSGRATRAEFWYFMLFNIIVTIILSFVDEIFGTTFPESILGLFGTIYTLIALLPSWALAVRRLHDINKSGWWILLSLIPIIGGFILLIFYCIDSKGNNEYGINKKGNTPSFENEHEINKNGNTPSFNSDSISELEKLSELKDKGIITQEEFDNKKRQILGF